ncbi:MAG TPA: hypothetical protein ENH11_00525 [Candidatus Acetothermia bacterium]|nr:hypothetical protein [Candidatus Acetothermia bacterium]
MEPTAIRTMHRFSGERFVVADALLVVEQQGALSVSNEEICPCGFVRGERLNIYSHEERITT